MTAGSEHKSTCKADGVRHAGMRARPETLVPDGVDDVMDGTQVVPIIATLKAFSGSARRDRHLDLPGIATQPFRLMT